MTRVGRTLSGTMDSRRTQVDAPPGHILNGTALLEGAASADGTLRGTFSSAALSLSSSSGTVLTETCNGELRWSMVRPSP